jgi:hypothetical protein
MIMTFTGCAAPLPAMSAAFCERTGAQALASMVAATVRAMIGRRAGFAGCIGRGSRADNESEKIQRSTIDFIRAAPLSEGKGERARIALKAGAVAVSIGRIIKLKNRAEIETSGYSMPMSGSGQPDR